MFPTVYDTKCFAWGVNLLRQEFLPDDRTLSDTNLFSLYSNISSLKQNVRPQIEPVNETVIFREGNRKIS